MASDTDTGTGEQRRRRATKALPVRAAATSHRRSGEDQTRTDARDGGQSPGTSGPERDVIDADVVDETDPPASTGTRRERLRDRAREFFGASTAERTSERDRRRRTDDDQAERAGEDGDDQSERERLLTLRSEITQAGDTFMASLRDSNLLVPGYNDEQRAQEFNAMHHVYMQMMMQGCLKPLTHGVNPHSIIQAAGMMAAMRLLSSDFRREMGASLQPLKDKIRDRIDARTDAARSWAQSRADKHNDLIDSGTAAALARRPERAHDETYLASREAKKTGRDAFLSAKWRRRLADMEHRERGHREMFTPASAAMTEVALLEDAFWKMRDPNYDSDEIYTSYRAMRKRLRDQMADDGLDRHEVVTRARVIIGTRMEAEPEMRLMFNGMAHGRIVKAPPRAERVAGTDRVRERWRGEFDDQLGRRIPDDGMFTLRRPMSAEAHQVQLAETMATSMLDGLRRDDQGAYAGSIMGYLVGFAARKENLDTHGLPDILRQRLDQSMSMLASMDIDGLHPDRQQEVYSNAFTDAMEDVAGKHPGVEESLRLSFGDDWQTTLQAAVDDPVGFVQQQRRRPRVYDAGTEGPAQQRAEFDWGWSGRHTDSGDYQSV